MNITLIVAAAAENGVIGKNGHMPWHISADLKRFKTLTVGTSVIMGRKTWDSLPRKPLPERDNIVVTRDPTWKADGAITATSPAAAMALATRDVMVIGGAQIYQHFLPQATCIELTEVQGDFQGDAFFRFDRSGWQEAARTQHVTPDGLAYSYVTLTRAI